MSITWTIDLSNTLIDLYRSQRLLWDTSHVDFKNINRKREAWQLISETMGLHVLEIKRKIKNLAAQFLREQKKIEERVGAGYSSDTPKWFAYNRLMFLSDRNETSFFGKTELIETPYYVSIQRCHYFYS